MDIASLVMAVIGTGALLSGRAELILFAVLLLPGLVLGIVALATSRKRRRPRSIAVAGTALNAAGLLLALFEVVLFGLRMGDY